MIESFRRALPGEVPEIFRLYERRVLWMNEKGMDSWNRNQYLHWYNEAYFRERQEAGQLYLLQSKEGPLAAAVLFPEDSRWNMLPPARAMYLHNLVSAPGTKGAGSRLLDAMEQVAASRGAEVLRLDCDRRLLVLKDWYASRGYRVLGECTEGNYRGFCLEKRLRGPGTVTIREACPEDAEDFARIYKPYVEKTAITCEVVPPDAAEFRRRMEAVQRRYPWLTAEEEQEDGSRRVVGYAYAAPFKGRAAYDWDCELSVYTEENVRGKGLGRRMYAVLEEDLRKMGMVWMYACITAPVEEDETLTRASIHFHERLGFAVCGNFPGCVNKFGRWYDMVWMKRQLAPCVSGPVPVRPWRECGGAPEPMPT